MAFKDDKRALTSACGFLLHLSIVVKKTKQTCSCVVAYNLCMLQFTKVTNEEKKKGKKRQQKTKRLN